MSKIFHNPRGTSDATPAEMPAWRSLEDQARAILTRACYQEIRTPMFEDTELFARSMGQTSDVVLKQMLNLTAQRKDETGQLQHSGLSLRPEGTAAVVRSYIQNHWDRKEHLSKLYYIGPMFRGERPQKGRLRQFHQIGLEAIGPSCQSPYIDAEVIALGMNIIQSIGIENVTLNINTLGSVEDKVALSKCLYDQIVPFRNELSEDSQQRLDRNVFRILDSKDPKDQVVVDRLDLGPHLLSEESQEYFDQVKEALDGLSIVYHEDHRLVRGLDYYTHTVFEYSCSNLGSQNAVGAGGRYASLVAQLGGSQVGAVGLALGMERLLLAAPPVENLSSNLDVLIMPLTDQAQAEAFGLTQNLRKQGYRCDMTYLISSVKSMMRQANKRQARFCMLIGDDELQTGQAQLKEMKSGEQTMIDFRDMTRCGQQLAKHFGSSKT